MLQPLELSVQLYSLRHLPDLEEQLRLVRVAGLVNVEATSSNYNEAGRVASLCEEFGLSMPSGHVGMDRLRSDFDGFAAIAKMLGIGTVVVWGLPEDEKPQSAKTWQAAGQELGGFADRFAAMGMRFAFHNHDWELQAFEDGRLGLDHLFEGASGSALCWQADLAWLARGGADIDGILKSHAGRLISVHVKDMARICGNSNEDGWEDLGHGILPWRDWWPRLRHMNISLMVLEHDEPNNPARFLTRSAAFAKQLEASM